MSDRQLLEDAARACGDEIDRWAEDENGVEYAWLTNGDPWQPLHRNTMTDCMGDALRLAVKLRINIAPMRDQAGRDIGWNVWPAGRGDCAANEDGNDAPALCRAITRAAAELGRAQQEGRTDATR